MEYPLKQGHWSIEWKGSMVVFFFFPREVQTCFLGHFTTWVENDLDAFSQLNDNELCRANRF